MSNETFASMVGQEHRPDSQLVVVVENPIIADTATKMLQAGDLYRYAKNPHQHIAIGN